MKASSTAAEAGDLRYYLLSTSQHLNTSTSQHITTSTPHHLNIT
ncbi:hypothetical protein [Leyella stercorea]|nr:hypothetical protein [Leyella stercorea]